MEQTTSNVIRSESQINYSYATIRLTQSRLDKGLIAIPVSLSKWFPDRNETIQVHLNDSPVSQVKQYSSYTSSTRECRIGGVKEWFEQNGLKSGDEIVVQFLDKEHFTYRLIPERNFVSKTQELEHNLDKAATELEASRQVNVLADWTGVGQSDAAFSEFSRLVNVLQLERQYAKKTPARTRETAPANLRTLLARIYAGHCQVCDFWFLKRDRQPYFEIHHLDPQKGHHPKNLLVVCGNCHNQFEHSLLRQEFDENQWLIKVCFNETVHAVNQAAIGIQAKRFFKDLFV